MLPVEACGECEYVVPLSTRLAMDAVLAPGVMVWDTESALAGKLAPRPIAAARSTLWPIADQAGQWLKCRTHEGRKAYGIRSSRDPHHVYFVTQASCDCFDAQRHVCKHQVAVQIHCARVAGQPMPASDVVGGLAQMVIERRGPVLVLDMIRHPDGEITWSRHEHPSGEITHLPLHAETVRLAAQYDRIFGRL
jgi:hypothetical protein